MFEVMAILDIDEMISDEEMEFGYCNDRKVLLCFLILYIFLFFSQ